MSSLAASSLGFLLIGLVIAPLAAAYWKPATRVPAALFYALLLSGLGLHYAGVSFGTVRPPPQASTSSAAAEAESSDELTRRCEQALDAAEDGSVIRDRSDPERLRVNGSLWSQLPGYVKEALIRCFEISHPAGVSDTRVEVVEE